MKRVRVLASVVAVLVGLGIGPAVAATYENPRVTHPIIREPYDPPPKVNIVLKGPRNIYGMRRVARNLNNRVPGIRIHYRLGIDCSDVRTASRCIPVKIVEKGEDWWYGFAHWGNDYNKDGVGDDPYCWIELNRDKAINQHTAGHELMHCLGMDHHRKRGLVGVNSSAFWASRREVRALRRAY